MLAGLVFIKYQDYIFESKLVVPLYKFQIP